MSQKLILQKDEVTGISTTNWCACPLDLATLLNDRSSCRQQKFTSFLIRCFVLAKSTLRNHRRVEVKKLNGSQIPLNIVNCIRWEQINLCCKFCIMRNRGTESVRGAHGRRSGRQIRETDVAGDELQVNVWMPWAS